MTFDFVSMTEDFVYARVVNQENGKFRVIPSYTALGHIEYASAADAREVAFALNRAFVMGQEDIRNGFRELMNIKEVEQEW